MTCAAGVVTLAIVRGGDVTVGVGLRVAPAALLVLAGALAFGIARLIPLPFVLLGGAYAVYLAVDDVPLDPAAPVLAAGLFLTAELAYWSLDERESFHGDVGETLRRIAVVTGLGAVALLASAGLLALADVAGTRGLAVDLVGALAASATLALIVVYARR
jgi:hypothetical protein